ncbi:hypothetical protein EP7_004009 [Isosphaeraceae bacterium EP7]
MSLNLALIWAQARIPLSARPVVTSSWLWNWAAAAVLGLGIIIGVIVIYYLRRDVSQADDPISVTEEEQLAEFERAYEAGEMDELEIRKVRDILRRRQGLESLPSATLEQLSPGPEFGRGGADEASPNAPEST